MSPKIDRRAYRARALRGPIDAALSRLFPGKKPERIVRMFAHHLHTTCGLAGPPFNPFDYARALGLGLERTEMEADGCLVDWPGSSCRILLRKSTHSAFHPHQQRRENFTVAHELGHYLVRENLDGFVPRTLFRREHADEERLCNIFAEELLMPRRHFLYDVKRHGTAPSSILSLCDSYQVSLQAMLYRVVGALRGDVCAVIWEKCDDEFAVFWAAPQRYMRVVLCDTGSTTVERAFASNEEESGRDDLLVEGRRSRWRCGSMRCNGRRVLTVATRNSVRFAPARVSHKHAQRLRPLALQMSLPFGSRYETRRS